LKTLHFDARFIRTDKHDGISRFSVELIKTLSLNIKVVAVICDKAQLKFLPKNINFVLVNPPESPREIFIAYKLNKLGATHVFSPMQLMGSLGRKYKLILTLHDLIYYRHRKPPQDLNVLIQIIWRLYHLTYIPQRLLLNRSDSVVTVSETTAKLIKEHRLTRKQVAVVYNAPEGISVDRPRLFPSIRDIIYIGSFMPYKNVETLVVGVGLLEGFRLHLLSKISDSRKVELAELARKSGTELVFHNGVTDQEYRDVLQGAFALASASKDEGFGIPLVESMQLGTPVVVSDLAIFREVAGPAGTYFSTNDPQSFADSITHLTNESVWRKKSNLSLTQANSFSWANSAEALLRAFDELGA
jgi:glycosyltransferase involved in cell wall biosynthesis